MSIFRLTINTDNAAFGDDAYWPELSRILRRVADDLSETEPNTNASIILDANGNTVGAWGFDGAEKEIT